MINNLEQVHISDTELIKKIPEDTRFFSVIVDRYSDKLSRYIRRITYLNEQDREDLLQNVFIKVFVNLNGFDESLSFNAWIYRITHNEVIDFVRKEKRKNNNGHLDIEDDVFTLIKNSSDFMDEVYQKEDAERIKNTISKMSEKYREIIYLRFIEQYSYRDISDILRKSESNVTTMIHRAKQEFKKLYQQEL